jgi:hypothetical protein
VCKDCEAFDVGDLDRSSDKTIVTGRLTLNTYKNFEFLGASDFVLSTLRHGHSYKINRDVPAFKRSNNKFFYTHNEFATKEIDNLIQSGKVKIVSAKLHCIHPLQVAVQRSKNRLILNCSFLNKFVEVPAFKFEDKIGLNYFIKDGFMFSFDFKDGYHHIAINTNFQKFLGFKFEKNGVMFYVQWKVAPFGLRDVPYIFTKIVRVFIKH